MRIAFCGGKSWGARCLKVLLEELRNSSVEHELVMVFLNKSEFNLPGYAEPIHKVACDFGIPSAFVSNPRELKNLFDLLQIDILISVFYDFIIPDELLSKLKNGAVNLHLGDSERYRGCYSTIRALLNNDSEFGVTLHYMIGKVDAGPIIDKIIFPVAPEMSGLELYELSLMHGVNLFADNIGRVLSGEVEARECDLRWSSYGKRILPQRQFERDDVLRDPDAFLRAVRAFDFKGFDGVELNLGRNAYRVTRRD